MDQNTKSPGGISRMLHVPFESLSIPEVAEAIREAEAIWESDPEDGIARFRSLAERSPQEVDFWGALGGAYDSSGMSDRAIPYYERALELSEKAPWRRYVCLQLSSSYRNVGRLEEAKRLLTESIERYPDFHVLSVMLSFVQHDQGQAGSAVRTLFDLLTFLSPDATAPYLRAMRHYCDAL